MRLGLIAALISVDVGTLQELPRDLVGELLAEELIERQSDTEDHYQLMERGRIFLDHLESLPLPELAQVWRMPLGASIEPVQARSPPAPAPQPGPPIPTDPTELRALAVRMLDNGYGLNETKQMLKLTDAQAQEFFYGGR